MMETELDTTRAGSFQLAGIVPVGGQPLDFELPWHDCLMPLEPNYHAVQHAVMECAWAGCETIWIVCHEDMRPLIRHIVGEYVYDPVRFGRKHDVYPKQTRKLIPIYYVPIHPKDKDKRDCLSWSVIHGAQSAYWTAKKVSAWIVPDRYYVSFPYGIYKNEALRKHRKDISSKNRFILRSENETVRDGHYLGFTFDAEDFKKIRQNFRAEGTGIRVPGTGMDGEKLPIEERWSARFFEIGDIFSFLTKKDFQVQETEVYYPIDSWEGYVDYMRSDLPTKPFKSKYFYNRGMERIRGYERNGPEPDYSHPEEDE